MNDFNLDREVCRLVLKALNKYKQQKIAMIHLGIGRTRLPNLMKKYNIIKIKGEYVKT